MHKKKNPSLVWKIKSGFTVFLCRAVNTHCWGPGQWFRNLKACIVIGCDWLQGIRPQKAAEGVGSEWGGQRRKTASGGGGGKCCWVFFNVFFFFFLKDCRLENYHLRKRECCSEMFPFLSENFKCIMWSYLFCDLRLCRWSQKLCSPLTASHYKCVDVVQPEFLLKCVRVCFLWNALDWVTLSGFADQDPDRVSNPPHPCRLRSATYLLRKQLTARTSGRLAYSQLC